MATVITNNIHIAHTSRFMCQGSSSNPPVKPEVSYLTSTRSHVANLEKLIGKPKTEHTIKPIDKKNRRDLPGWLNLPWISPAPEGKSSGAAEYLSRLQQLLSKTPENSPKNNLGSRWREYHGSAHWAGLLDPLDQNLRREIVRYGEFVQAAYNAFLVDPSATSTSTHVALPDRSYKVTRSLYATSSVGIPRWLENAAAAADVNWMTQRTSRIGYVAVCDDPNEIRRMGRRDILIALRGTATCLEWVENFRPRLVQIPESSEPNQPAAKVARGFLSLFHTRGSHAPSLSETVLEEVQRLLECYRGETLSITVTGHSLGAALSILVADEISASVAHAPPIAVFSFGSPRVGNKEFAERVEKKVRVLRVANSQDLITRVPGIPINGSGEQGQNGNTNNTGGVARAMNMMDYSHVGEELRIDTRKSPYLKPDADVACCHDLEAYLHLVDGFLASNCPFRQDAKRSLRKLMNAQRSNVKIYTGKKRLEFSDLVVGDRDGLSPVSGCLPSPS